MPGVKIKALQYDDKGLLLRCGATLDKTGIRCGGCKQGTGLSLMDGQTTCRKVVTTTVTTTTVTITTTKTTVTTITTTTGTTKTTTTTTLRTCDAGQFLDRGPNKCTACPNNECVVFDLSHAPYVVFGLHI
jgi:hypothetical protein